VFLQGACADLNPPLEKMTREEMLANVDFIMQALGEIPWSGPVEPARFRLVDLPLRLCYQPVPSVERLREFFDGMQLIAATGNGPQREMAELANVLNVEPGQEPEPKMMRYIASVLQQWSGELLESSAQRQAEGRELSMSVWELGPVTLCFVAAEVFVETAIALRQGWGDRLLGMVGYASPLVGYLPTDEALDEGGYEVEYAYRFYGQPAPFAKGSEPAVVRAIRQAISAISI
jgi:hypothetical protein